MTYPLYFPIMIILDPPQTGESPLPNIKRTQQNPKNIFRILRDLPWHYTTKGFAFYLFAPSKITTQIIIFFNLYLPAKFTIHCRELEKNKKSYWRNKLFDIR